MALAIQVQTGTTRERTDADTAMADQLLDTVRDVAEGQIVSLHTGAPPYHIAIPTSF